MGYYEKIVKKHIKEAEAVDLTLIGAGKNARYRTYRFNKCNHEQEFYMNNVHNNKFRCEQCQLDKIQDEAKARGLTLIGAGKNARYRTYHFNACGHEQEIQTGMVRRNSFICNTCEETSRDLPSKVYLLEITVDSFTWLKLGYAKTIRTRISKYGLPQSKIAKRLKAVDFDKGRKAHLYEQSLHKKYIRKRLPLKKMKEFHTVSGFKECYPMKMKNKLLRELSGYGYGQLDFFNNECEGMCGI